MTVGELIEKLQDIPEDRRVLMVRRFPDGEDYGVPVHVHHLQMEKIQEDGPLKYEMWEDTSLTVIEPGKCEPCIVLVWWG
jgi:hypothetical protein